MKSSAPASLGGACAATVGVMTDQAVVFRPTARLVAAAWALIALGLAVLIAGWIVFGETAQAVMAPLGWLILAAGVSSAAWAGVRKARNRDALQAQAARQV